MGIIFLYTVLIYILGSIILVMKKESEGLNSKWDENQNDSILIKLSMTEMVIGVLGSIFFVGTLMYFVSIPEENKMIQMAFNTFFGVLSIMCISLIVTYFNWGIIVRDDYFIYRTFFKNTFIFNYNDIVKIHLVPHIVMIKVKDKWLFMNPNGKGMEHFVNKINQAFETEDDKKRNIDQT